MKHIEKRAQEKKKKERKGKEKKKDKISGNCGKYQAL